MSLAEVWRRMVPASVRGQLRPIQALFEKKHDAEFTFWKRRLKTEGTFDNAHFRQLMLAMAEESTDDFLRGKVVADFGCGPRGSLVWATPASLRIGIDVLADRYYDEFRDQMLSHGMIYLTCTEHGIPLPSDFVDVMFTLNAIDHVDGFSEMCAEILRVLKPGGELIDSFNLDEPPTMCEPQQLDEEVVKEHLLTHLAVRSYRKVHRRHPKSVQSSTALTARYAEFFDDTSLLERGRESVLWVRAVKSAEGAIAPSVGVPAASR